MLARLISPKGKAGLCLCKYGVQRPGVAEIKKIRIELGLRYRRDLSQLVPFHLGGMVALQSAESP